MVLYLFSSRSALHQHFHEIYFLPDIPELSDANAVLDPELRVNGVSALRVIDASAMPKITSANTNAPSMMIGHRAGQMIAKDAA